MNAPQPREHHEIVAGVAAEVKERVRDRLPVHIYKGGVHHFVPIPGDRRFRSRPIDISGLNRVLEIDPVARTCIAEPGVTFADLLRETLRHRLIPTVVPELEGITVGGAVAGCSVESMSFREGGFHDSCLEYELVTGDGQVIRCSREREPLAFDMVHGSYGTLAILTRLKFRLVPAKPYVRVEYRKFADFSAFNEALASACRVESRAIGGGHDFVDAIAHSPTEWVLCLGWFVESAPYTSDYRREKIFYKSTRERPQDYLTTEQYCFRYDTECHWLSRSVPGLENPFVRRLVARRVLGSTNLIRWSGRLDRILRLKKRPDVVVDVFIPSRRLEEFCDWYRRELDYWPLWIVPYRIPRMYPWVSNAHAAKMAGDELMIDCAVYGKPNSRRDVDYSERLEQKTYELGGIKTLISRNHYTQDRFWEIYHRGNYDETKRRLDPQGVFKGLYEKFHR